jgi:hypothetical protein
MSMYRVETDYLYERSTKGMWRVYVEPLVVISEFIWRGLGPGCLFFGIYEL